MLLLNPQRRLKSGVTLTQISTRAFMLYVHTVKVMNTARTVLHEPSDFDRWHLPPHVAQAVWRGTEVARSSGRALSYPRWPGQFPPSVGTVNSPRQGPEDYTGSALMAMRVDPAEPAQVWPLMRMLQREARVQRLVWALVVVEVNPVPEQVTGVLQRFEPVPMHAGRISRSISPFCSELCAVMNSWRRS